MPSIAALVASTALLAAALPAVAIRAAALEAGSGAAAFPPEQARIPAAALARDAEILRQALVALHPGLHRSNAPDEIAARFASLEAEFREDRTLPEAFLAVSRLTAGIRCGHTFPNPANQSKAVSGQLLEGKRVLPVAFRWIDRRMIVTRDCTEGSVLPRGSEILSIDGTPVAAILDRLLPFGRADGSNDAKRIGLFEVRGDQRCEAFDLYHSLLFPSASPTYQLVVRRPGATAEEALAIPATTAEGRRSGLGAEPEPRDGEPLWRLAYLDDGIAYLRMPSWVAYKTSWDWQGFVHATFDELAAKQVPALVIDLRGNEGGSGVGEVILSRLVDRPTLGSSMQRFVRYRQVPGELAPFLDTWDDSFRDWGEEALGPLDIADRQPSLPAGTTGGFYRLREGNDPKAAEPDGMVAPRGARFAGRLFVLIDASNSSATFEFVSAVKRLGLGTLVGQPTGGNQRGINGGAFFFLRLPGSGIEVDLPLIAQYPRLGTGPRPDAGIEPDIPVRPTVEAIRTGADLEMAAVRASLRSSK